MKIESNSPCEKVEHNSDSMKSYTFGICLAGKKIEIECLYKKTKDICTDYLAQFGMPDFCVKVNRSEIEEASGRVGASWVYNFSVDNPKVAITIAPSEAEPLLVYRKIVEEVLWYDILLIHGVAIAIDGKCYVFTAASGTGKTTHARNWLKKLPESYIINGDKPLIDTERMLVYGTPWCGKEEMNTNTAVQLAGIISLERGERNSIEPISFSEMLPVLLQQTYIPRERAAVAKACGLIGRFNQIPCFRLVCNMDPESAVIAYRGLQSRTSAKS